MLTPELLAQEFAAALPYDAYVQTGTPDQQARWLDFHARVALTEQQRRLIAGFTRRVNVLVISGMWCGDCVQQCPMLDHFAKVKPAGPGDAEAAGIDLRFVDRERHIGLSNIVKICGGNRVPTAIFMNEEFDFVSLAGDKSLSRFRSLAARQLGPSCPMPDAPVPQDEIVATTADWLAEVERVHLLVRLSQKLRTKHGD